MNTKSEVKGTHTPGPWEYRNFGDGSPAQVGTDEREFAIANIHEPNADANAHLIAASPDMYEALEFLQTFATSRNESEEFYGEIAVFVIEYMSKGNGAQALLKAKGS